ncbi:hypothetical protein NSI01_48960 [Pimelobacter simplex]|nr:hypothetical protein NSI01_48960 [Pimelobacter simplex]
MRGEQGADHGAGDGRADHPHERVEAVGGADRVGRGEPDDEERQRRERHPDAEADEQRDGDDRDRPPHGERRRRVADRAAGQAERQGPAGAATADDPGAERRGEHHREPAGDQAETGDEHRVARSLDRALEQHGHDEHVGEHRDAGEHRRELDQRHPRLQGGGQVDERVARPALPAPPHREDDETTRGAAERGRVRPAPASTVGDREEHRHQPGGEQHAADPVERRPRPGRPGVGDRPRDDEHDRHRDEDREHGRDPEDDLPVGDRGDQPGEGDAGRRPDAHGGADQRGAALQADADGDLGEHADPQRDHRAGGALERAAGEQ